MTARERRAAARTARLMPLSDFPAAKQAEIAEAVAQPTPPPQWLHLGTPDAARPLAAITSRAWAEWYLQRGIDPFEPRRDKVPSRVRATVIARDGLTCQLCGGQVAPEDVHLDHIQPWSLGGKTTVANLQVTHSACNMRKGARLNA